MASDALSREEERKKREAELATSRKGSGEQEQSKLGGAGGGAASGAAAGTMVMPGIGTLIGAGVGAAAGAAESNKLEKDAASGGAGRPQRRKLAAGIAAREDVKGRRTRAMNSLAQAVFDWAASIR